MDDTAQETGDADPVARLPAPLNSPATEPESARGAAPIPTSILSSATLTSVSWRVPELLGADELAAAPRPFPPLPAMAPPLVAPPAPAPAVVVPASPPTAASADFAMLLSTPAVTSAGPSPAGSPFGLRGDDSEEHDIATSSRGEVLVLIVAILLPPLGLFLAIVAAVRSARRRGWVIGLLRASLAIGVVLTVAAGIGGEIGWTALQHQQAHDRVAGASAAFCSTIKADPAMIRSPTFGWPAVGATIADSLGAMHRYEDRWKKLAAVSPAGIEPEVTKVAAAAGQIIQSVTVGRAVDDEANTAVMTRTASASQVPAWYAEYCD